MRSIFALLLIAVFSAYAFRSHFIAMLLYWWFGIFRPHEWMWWDVSSLRLPLLASAIFIVPMLLKGFMPSFKDGISKLLLLMAGLAIMAQAVHGCDFATPVDLKIVVVLAAVTAFTYTVVEKPYQVITLLIVVAASLTYHSAKTGIDAVLGGKSLYGAQLGSGGFTGTNAMAMGTAMAMFFLLFGIQCLIKKRHEELIPALTNKNGFRVFLLVGLMTLIFGGVSFIILTSSRGSMLALCLGVLVWTLLHPRRLIISTTLTVLLVLVVSITGVSTELKERIGSVFVEQSELDRSAASRPHFWRTATLIANDHPLGIGVGCYKTYYNQYDTTQGEFGIYRSVHSSHYAILAELGYVGIVAWMLIFALCFFKLFKIRQYHKHRIQQCNVALYYVNFSNVIISTLVVFLFGGSFYEIPYNDYLWIMFACVIAVNRHHESQLATNEKT